MAAEIKDPAAILVSVGKIGPCLGALQRLLALTSTIDTFDHCHIGLLQTQKR